MGWISDLQCFEETLGKPKGRDSIGYTLVASFFELGALPEILSEKLLLLSRSSLRFCLLISQDDLKKTHVTLLIWTKLSAVCQSCQ